MFIWWGPELIQFYNDAYRETMGRNGIRARWERAAANAGQEIWDIIGPQIEYVMAATARPGMRTSWCR